jgi:Tfp pilus assembly protein PilO
MNILRRQGSWVVTLSLTAMAAVYLAFLWLPGHRAIQSLEADVESQRLFLTQATGMSEKAAALQHELDRTEAFTAAWKKTASSQNGISALYGKIHTLAKETGLKVTLFDPQPIMEYEIIREIPLTVACSGTFSQIYEFLRNIEGLPMPIQIHQVILGKMKENVKHMHCELNLVVFSANPQSPDCIK